METFGFIKENICSLAKYEFYQTKLLFVALHCRVAPTTEKLADFFLESSVKEISQLKKLGKLIEV